MNTTTNQAPLPIDQAIKQAIHVIREFRSVIDQETQALQSSHFGRAVALKKKKDEMLSFYADTMEAFGARAEELKTLPESLKKEVQQEKALFKDSADANRQALQRAGQITKRLSERMVKLAKQAVAKEGVNYTQYGTTRQSFIKPLHMQMNETF
jgi:predicted DNA binding CopG/RHH family protein